MKHQWLSISGILLLAAFVGCNQGATNNTAITGTSTAPASAADTSAPQAAGADTSVTSGATTTSATVATLDKDDQEFVTKAAQGGIAEVTLGQLAAARAKSDDVRAFGNQMVSDHGKANDELQELARLKGVTLPSSPGKEGEQLANSLSKEDKAFDKDYMADMVKDHEQDVKEFERASQNAGDPGVKAWAANTLPTLRNHLRMARETLAKVEAGRRKSRVRG